MLLPAVGQSSLFHATSSLFHVESVQVKSSQVCLDITL